jgi:RNA polymerase sigma-70 factor (sigma-E family)
VGSHDQERDRVFTAFVTARYSSLLRSAFLLTGDRGHAEDLVQAALVRTLLSWGRLRDPAKAEPYTRTTMLRLAGRWRRRRWNAEVPTPAMPEPSTWDGTGSVEEAAVVRSALMALPWEQRAVLVLRYFDDRPEAEVAALLGCSVGTVKSRTSRALAALRARGVLTEQEVHRDC